VQKTRRALNRITRGRIASWQNRRPEVHRSLESLPDASHEKLAAPDRSVVPVARAVETHTNQLLVPSGSLGEHGSDVGAMVLHSELGQIGLEFESAGPRRILWMRIMDDEQVAKI